MDMRAKIGQVVTDYAHRTKLLLLQPSRIARVTGSLVKWWKFIRSYAQVHHALILLTIFILLNNIIVVRASDQIPDIPADALLHDPYEVADTVRLLADYTPNINEDPDQIATGLEEQISGSFISTNPLVATAPSEEPTPVTQSSPSPSTTSPKDRSRDIKYRVAFGDTLSGIGSKFDLKIATLKVKNNLSDVDTIKPGQELLIPIDDLSDKALKAAEDRKKASVRLAQTAKASNGAPQGGYGLIVPLHHNGISRGLVGGHTGIDYRANVGTPIAAAADGVVVIADENGWNGGYGKTVLIAHGSNMTTRYGHMSDVRVTAGQRVSQGDLIGLSGNSGRSTGPHLHFELRVNGIAKNPFP